MIVPLSWLKQYINTTLDPKLLGEKLTEVGLGVEHIRKEKDDVIFELEITPNRPDWLSMIGVAREIAAIEGKNVKYPEVKHEIKPKKNATILPLTIHPNFKITQRLTGIIINNVTVKESPAWLKNRLASIGQRSINNIVDITNFVMWELGNPIHSFDYHKIAGHEMWIKQAKGGEAFESVDDIKYHLPKGAIIFEDKEKIFDLVGIKGGRNSGTYEDTKAIFLVFEVDDPVLIRKASQALSLRSDASAIFERGVNKNGTIDALRRTVDLVLETAGGEIASELIDLKEQEFKPWKVSVRFERLERILGFSIPQKEVIDILERLQLSPKIEKEQISCTIPTYRNDLQIEEDLIEEVARLYGYNKFPKTMIEGHVPTEHIPFFKDYTIYEKAKNILIAAGFSEIYTYSLISEKDLIHNGINPEHVLRVDNPVSREFEYLRPNLAINLKKAFIQNAPNFPHVNLFELGKVYLGKSLDKAEEVYYLSGITNSHDFRHIKGILERIFNAYGLEKFPYTVETDDDALLFEVNFSELLKKMKPQKPFIPIAKYPAITEDHAFNFHSDIAIGDIIDTIKEQSTLIIDVTVLDQYKDTITFHIVYQNPNKNLTKEEVGKIREKIISSVEKQFGAKIK